MSTAALGRIVRGPDVWSRRRANAWLPWIAAGVLVLLAVVGPLLAPHDPNRQQVGAPLEAPSSSHPFGTDQFGRDVLSRVLAGFQISLGVGLGATVVALAVGAVLGGMAATLGRFADEGIMRTLDVVLAFPGILLAVVMAAVLGAGWTTTVIVMAVVYAPGFARVVRATVMGEMAEDYVTAARLIGSSRIRVLTYHVGVNAVLPVVVFATVILADAIVLQAALSFIGVGIRPPSPAWGNIMAEGRAFIGAGSWWITAFAGLAIFGTVLVLNWLSERLRRRLER